MNMNMFPPEAQEPIRLTVRFLLRNWDATMDAAFHCIDDKELDSLVAIVDAMPLLTLFGVGKQRLGALKAQSERWSPCRRAWTQVVAWQANQ